MTLAPPCQSPGKKITALGRALLVFLLSFMLAIPPAQAKSNPRYASIVIDADTGAVLSESAADKSLHPASLAKIMTLVLAFEALDQGRLRLSDRITVSRHAAAMVPSKLNLPAGSSIRVEDAIYALVTKSANDIAVALAERIGGTESRFATMMTRKAQAIGMSRTTYMNASGLHHPRQVSTARDQAALARYVVNAYPRYYQYFSTRNFSYRGANHHNHNRLMESYKGMDGIKTGYIGTSGFNLVASAKRGDRRLIGVVFGGRTASSRNTHMASLLDRGFAKSSSIAVAAKKAPIPGRKPAEAVQVAALNGISTAAGKSAEMNALMQGETFSSMIGEGDYDPAVTKRLETGLMAIAALREDLRSNQAVTPPAKPVQAAAAKADDAWAVQIGAFSSRVQTDKAIQAARGRLPPDLARASAIIVPLKTKDGWMFRGRLSGYDKAGAARACKYLPDCLPVSPQAN